MKGIKLVPTEEISEEAKAKLEKLKVTQKAKLKELLDRYKSGKFDEFFDKL